jgi:hypothetical protein
MMKLLLIIALVFTAFYIENHWGMSPVEIKTNPHPIMGH